MTIAAALLAEFEQEALTTRKFLTRLPEGKLLWRPHEKSMTAGQLAFHIALAPGSVVKMAELDRASMPDFDRANPQPESLNEILESFEASVGTVRESLRAISDERMHATWRMTKDGHEILCMPRLALYRSILLNHWYHHRGQFGVYLRLLGAIVPSSYGPSGDELPDFSK